MPCCGNSGSAFMAIVPFFPAMAASLLSALAKPDRLFFQVECRCDKRRASALRTVSHTLLLGPRLPIDFLVVQSCDSMRRGHRFTPLSTPLKPDPKLPIGLGFRFDFLQTNRRDSLVVGKRTEVVRAGNIFWPQEGKLGRKPFLKLHLILCANNNLAGCFGSLRQDPTSGFRALPGEESHDHGLTRPEEDGGKTLIVAHLP